MRSEEDSRKRDGNRFNDARGAASTLQMSPPFAFNDVTMSVFPLRAGLPRLESFCRNYLNQDPDSVQFRPFIPFVYLVLLDYGRMSLEAANMGWVSQREVAFGIPLRWFNVNKRELEFHDWAFTSPFIFVDNPMSMSTGREVYGWPKLLARLDASVSDWVRDPNGPRKVFEVSTKRAAKAYAGEYRDYRTFLSVMQHQTQGLLDVPSNLDSIARPLSQISESVGGLMRLSKDLFGTFAGMASDGITGSSVLPDFLDRDVVREQLRPEQRKKWLDPANWSSGVRDLLWALFPRAYANTINLKQFRDAGDPVAACYQAITAARMPVRSLKKGGLLGAQNVLLGQLDGGYRIDIHHLAGLPIVESLGIEVTEERVTDGVTVSSINPVCPFWLQVDMSYGKADTVISRGREGEWSVGNALREARRERRELERQREADKKAAAAKRSKTNKDRVPGKSSGRAEKQKKPGEFILQQELERDQLEDTGADATTALNYLRAMNFFNTARGATEALGGGFKMPDASVRVLPIKAEAATLNAFVSEYLRIENKMRFEAWGDFVYVIVSDFEQMTSETNAISTARSREVKFAVPVKCYNWFDDSEYPDDVFASRFTDKRQDRYLRGARKMVTTGFVVPFAFVDDVTTAINDSEVTGVPSLSSAILSPENDWLSIDFSDQSIKRDLVTTRAQVLPALAAGAEAIEREVVEVHTHTPPTSDATESEHFSLHNWIKLLSEDLETKLSETDALNIPKKEGIDDTQIRFPHTIRSDLEPLQLGRGFALKLLAGELSFNQFSFKQFRDAMETKNACYQGLVMGRHKIQNLHDLREFSTPLHVSITDYPTLPVATLLGLKSKYAYPGADRTVRVFEATRPFAFRGDLHKDAGVTLFERLEDPEWQPVDYPEQIFGRKHLTTDQEFDEIPMYEDAVRDNPDAMICYTHRENPDSPIETVENQRADGVILNPPFTAFTEHLEKRQIVELHFDERYEYRKVDVLANEDLLDAFGKDTARDAAAYNAQMTAALKQRQFPAYMVAGALEFVSPDTIVAHVLSAQWGLDDGTARERVPRLPHGIPVTTVSSEHRDILFPVPERQNGYWPMSESFQRKENRRRTSEVLQFIAEFWAVIDVAIVALEMQNFFVTNPEEDVEPNEQLLRRLVVGEERGATRGGKVPQEDVANWRRKTEFGAFVFERIPEAFQQQEPVENFFNNLETTPYKIIGVDDWRKLRAAIDDIVDYLTTHIPDDMREFIDEFYQVWSSLIDRNVSDMQAMRDAIIEFGDGSYMDAQLEDYRVDLPIERLQARLSRLVTVDVLPDEDD